MESETILIEKNAIVDLVRVKEEFDSIVESLQLMADPKFMSSHKKSQQQIQKKQFVNWDEL